VYDGATPTHQKEQAVVALDERTATVVQPGDARFDDLFRSAYREMHSLTYRLLGDRQEAEDVVQEAFLKLNNSDVLRRPDDEVCAWLRRVCLNTAHNRLRSNRRADHHTDRAARLAEPAVRTSEPLDDVLLREQQAAVRRALAALPPNQRDTLLLRHSGYSYAEIAATLEISIGSVGVFLARGERAFRSTYENQEQGR
jgi:RNA polymerase sigma-70 factor (ECF subfamily)